LTEIWKEPARGETLGEDYRAMPASERVRLTVYDRSRPVPPVTRLLGVAVTQMGPGTVTCSLPVTGWLQHFNGLVEPTFPADLAMRWVVESVAPSMMVCNTAQLHVNYVRTVLLDAVNLIAKARTVHVGRAYGVAQVEIEDTRGRLMTHAVGRYAIRSFEGEPAGVALEVGGQTPDPYLRPPAGRVISLQRLAQMAGRENAEVWAAAVNDAPIAHLLGTRVVNVGDGTATVAMPVTPWLLSVDQGVVRGLLVTAPHIAMYGALGSIESARVHFRPADVRVDFFGDVAADGREISATASVEVHTDDSDLATAQVHDSDGNLFAFASLRTVRTEDPLRRGVDEREPERVLATVLFTDVVGSTEKASELGDDDWNDVLARHHGIVREQLERHGGREVKVVGDGFLATFDSPAKAIRCARAITTEVPRLGIEVRAGVHTGECEVTGGDLGGITVHIGARVADAAGPRQVMVSGAVRDMLAGSSFRFHDRGVHQLKGVEGEWRLYSVEQ
jgi:uncharacterized protein (TIGR00369 family)